MTKFDDSTVSRFGDYVNRLLKLKTLMDATETITVGEISMSKEQVVEARQNIRVKLNEALIVCDDMGFEIVEGLAE